MLAVLALRRAVVELLTHKTMAGAYVYDTRLDEINVDDVRDMRPVLSVYTEEDEAAPYHQKEHYPSNTTATVVLEAMVLGSHQLTIQNGDGSEETVTVADIADCDAATESLLDTLCYQVRRRMALQDADTLSSAYALIAMEVRSVHSYPQRTPDKASRIAARSMHFKIKIPTDKEPVAAGILPEPLASIAAKLTLPSSIAIVSTIAARLAPPAAVDKLELVTITAIADGAVPVTALVSTP